MRVEIRVGDLNQLKDKISITIPAAEGDRLGEGK